VRTVAAAEASGYGPELIELGRSLLPQPSLSFRRFLDWVKKTASAGGRKWSVTLIANRAVGGVDSDNRHADRSPAAALKLNHLISEVIYHAVDLLDHRLRQCADRGHQGRRQETREHHGQRGGPKRVFDPVPAAFVRA
jgi:hypothetical protein